MLNLKSVNNIVRRAGIDDLEDIVNIENRVFKEPWNRDQLSYELSQVSGKIVNVIEEKGIIGYIMIQKLHEEAHILNIAIDVRFQCRGYGKILLKHSLGELGKGIDVFLEVRESNLQARKLYSDFNFEGIDTRERYYSDGENALVMHRRVETHGVV